MPVPSPRNKLLPARGEYLTIEQALPSLFEGEFVWANDTNKYYQVVGGALQPVTVNPSELALVIQSVSDVDAKADQNASDIALNSQNIVDEAQLRVVNDTALQGQIDSLGTDASALTGRVGQNEAAITSIETNIDSVEETLDVKADLVDGLVPTSQLPGIAISEFLGEVADEVAMLALTGEQGDWCIRSDVSDTYVITGDDPSLLVNWTELATPASPVTSVNGQVGAVVLGAADVGAIPATDAPNFAPNTVDLQGVTNNGNTTTTGASFGNTVQSPSFFGNATGTAQVWYGGATGTSVIAADGTGTFSGDLRVQDGGNFRVRSADDATQDAVLLQNNGSITAAGTVASAGYAGPYASLQVPTGETEANYGVYTARNIAGTPVAQIFGDGSAKFASGNIEFNLYGQGIFKRSDSDAYPALSILDSGDSSDAITLFGTGAASFSSNVITTGDDSYYSVNRTNQDQSGTGALYLGFTDGDQKFKVGVDGSGSFEGNIQANKPRSSTAGSDTGGLCINPSDSTMYYNFRVDEVDNDLRIDTSKGADKIKFSPSGKVTLAGNLDLTDSNIDLYSQTTNSASKIFQIFSDIGGAKTEKVFVTADGGASFKGDVQATDGTNTASINKGGTVYVNQATSNNSASTPAFRAGSTANGTTAEIFTAGSASFTDNSSIFAGINGGSAVFYGGDSSTTSQTNAKFRLNTNGSASFDEAVSATAIKADYNLQTSDRASSLGLFIGTTDQGNATPENSTASITGDGAFTAAGAIRLGGPVASGYKRGFIADPLNTDGSYLQVYTENGKANNALSIYNGDLSKNVASIDSSGAASFEGQVGSTKTSAGANDYLFYGASDVGNDEGTWTEKFAVKAGGDANFLNSSDGAYTFISHKPAATAFSISGGSTNDASDPEWYITPSGNIKCSGRITADSGLDVGTSQSYWLRVSKNGTTNIIGFSSGTLMLGGTLDPTFAATQQPNILLESSLGTGTFLGTVSAQGSVLTSDARFKTDITDASSQLDDVVALGNSLRNWSWTEEAPVADKETRFLGLIAQEAEEICPGIVTTIERTDDSYKAIKNDVLVMKLLGAVAELKAEVEDLKQKLAEA